MANKSVLELAIETGKWDSGLKKAQQALDRFVSAGGGLNSALEKDNEKIRQFVQMMGKMESTANTAKGQMNDYKRTLESLTFQYNTLTDAQKKVVGGDFLKSIDSIKEKFQQAKDQVADFNKSIGDIKEPKIEVKGGDSTSGIGNMLAVFGGNMMTKAVGALTDLGQKALDVANQSARMASAAEGVRLAFERIDDGSLLDKLREATHGTVNDLELMKAAVKFNDFKLPLDQLGTMLAFAQQKAKDTGQSVDYLVDSIVMGLGRQSLMILDNLGLSAAEIKARMAETGDMTTAVGEIIREQMQSAGDYAETAADRTQKATAEMENAMLDLGVAIQNTFNISGGVEGFETFLRTDLARTMTDVVNWLGEIKTAITEIGTSNGFEAMCNVLDSLVIPKLTGITTQLRNIKAFIDGLTGSGSGNMSMGGIAQSFRNSNAQVREQVKSALPTYTVKTDADGNVISATNTKGKDVTEQYKKNLEDAHSVDNLITKLRELEEERRKAITAGQSDVAKDLLKQINQTKQDITGLDPNALKTNKPSTTTTKKNAWAPIEMQSFNFAAIPLGRSKEDIQKDINYWKKIDSTSLDVAGSVEAQKNVEKYERELAARKEMENPFAEAYSYDFSKDMERLSKETKKDDKSAKEIYEKQLAATGEMVGGIQQMVGGLNQLGIEIPEGFSNMLGGLQGIITILEAIQTIQTAGAILGIFHNGGLIGKAAGGMLIPGNSYSGDHLRMPVDGGAGWIGVNSGELILNRAQQNSIAGQLTAAERGGGGYQGTPYVEGEKIFLGINNYLRRSGRGEIVTSR